MQIEVTRLVIAGLLATLAMDLVSHFLTLIHVYRGPANVGIIGRWSGHMLRGTFVHKSIHGASPFPHEASLGFLAHYAIGVVLALIYGALLEGFSLTHGVVIALAYGFATNALPWFWLFPACGFGIMGLKQQGLLRSSLINHLVFGFGLYLALA